QGVSWMLRISPFIMAFMVILMAITHKPPENMSHQIILISLLVCLGASVPCDGYTTDLC
ncbi:hypothetical protein ACJX0J_012804, partial [Zea mays]